MGTWGTSIFANDLAADIRGDWREALEDGLGASQATKRLVERYAEAWGDPDERPVFWTSLAAAQMATGRLQDDVRDEALAVIEAGGDVDAFAAEDPRLGRQRARALDELAHRLRGPQRAPSAIRRPKPHQSPVAMGDVVLIHGLSDRSRLGLFLVTGLADGWPRGSKAPEMVALAWRGDGTPTQAQIERLPFLGHSDSAYRHGTPRVKYFTVQGPTKGPNAFSAFGEIVASGVRRSDAPAPKSHVSDYGYCSWRYLAGLVEGPWFPTWAEWAPPPFEPLWRRIRSLWPQPRK